jgi:hypothetical protein
MSFDDKHREETYKALITLATGVLKMALGLNGAAVIALLAFVRDPGPHSNINRPIIIFVIGIVLAALAHVGAYLTQLVLFNESMGRAVPPRHEWYLWISVGMVILSVAAFCWGAISAAHRIHP